MCMCKCMSTLSKAASIGKGNNGALLVFLGDNQRTQTYTNVLHRYKGNYVRKIIAFQVFGLSLCFSSLKTLPEIRDKMAAKPGHYTQQWCQNSIRNVWENIVFR